MSTVSSPLIPYEDMLKAGMHFGRRRTVFNPAMQPFVFTVRDGICIIDLLKTQEKLEAAIDFLKKSLEEGKLILFVAPTKQSEEGIKTLADTLGMPHVLNRWLGGTLTNYKIINGRVKRMEEMERQQAAGDWEKYTKKERLELERDLGRMRVRFDGLRKLSRIPDILFISSIKEGKLAVAEAKKLGLVVAGIVNTDANPRGVDFPIPANERSKVSLDLILNAINQELSKVKKA